MKSYEVQCSATEFQIFEKTGAAQSFLYRINIDHVPELMLLTVLD